MQITIKDNKIKDLSTIELNNLRTSIFFIKMFCFVRELSLTEHCFMVFSSSHIYTKKRGASYRTRPALRGLRIAHTV